MEFNTGPLILLVDDDVELLRSLELLLRVKYRILTADSVSKAKAVVNNTKVDVAVVDLNFEGQEHDGIDLMNWLSKEYPDIAVVVLSGDHCTERVVNATKRRDLIEFLPKTSSYTRDLDLVITKGIDARKKKSITSSANEFFTRSPVVKQILNGIMKIASSQSDCSVLITGETGTGKEYLAKYFAHAVKKPLVAANMASIQKNMAESELFGHRKGAFTGAYADKPGLMSQAHRGIFFLDEIGECSLEIQTKLLRAIQEKEVMPVGAPAPHKIDVRFVAATNRNLVQMVEQGTFRLDLLNRLNTVTLNMPPLRERPEDIEAYTSRFLKELSKEQNFSLKASGLDALMSYPWPGNVRELRNVIERIVILSDTRILDGDTVQDALIAQSNSSSLEVNSKHRQIRTEILNELEKTHGNRTQAATNLRMHPTTIFRWIKKLGIGNTFAGKSGRPSTYVLEEGHL